MTSFITTHGLKGLLTLAVSLSVSAQAGTLLKLQSGTIDAREMETAAFQLFSNSTSAAEYTADYTAEYIVQFKNVVTEDLKSELSLNGVKVFRYLPEDALVVRSTQAKLDSLREKLNINAIVPFKGAFKVGANVPTLSVFSHGQKMPISITTFEDADADIVLARLVKMESSVRLLNQDGRYLSVAVDISAIPSIANMNGVEFVQKIDKMVPFAMNFDEASDSDLSVMAAGDYSDLNGFETGTKVMNMSAAWALGYAGNGQTVGMADTGLDTGVLATLSPDFKGTIQGNGYIFGAGAKDWSDPMGHGTHVAGSVMGRGVTSSGKIKGAAYEAMMVPQGMWSPIIDNLTVPPQLGRLFEGAYKDGARIHTNSWGAANSGGYDSMAQKVDEFMWNNPDMLVLFAAGNSGVDKNKDGIIDLGSVASPGTSKNTLTVGASENLVSNGGIQKKIGELRSAKDSWPVEPFTSSKLSDDTNGVAVFSSRGPAADGRLKPEIVAPGTNVLSNRSPVKDASPLWGEYNASYAWSGGTSMATPLTAGAAAVARQILIEKHGIKNPSAALVKASLMHTAFNMFPGQYGTGAVQEIKARPDNNQGYGRVDMARFVGMGANTVMTDSATGVATGEILEQKVSVSQGQLMVNLVYTDAPGTPSSGAALVNNLDLIVMDSSGKVLSQSDAINNAEFFEKKGLAAGVYTIQVKGTNVPMGKAGKQPFALVYSAL
jgi:serine protease AprX